MTGNNRELRDDGLRNEGLRDDGLRERFAALRREEEAQAPPFAVPSRRGAEHGRWRSAGRLIGVTACLAAITAGVLWLRVTWQKPGGGHGNPVASLTDWKAPTDFLLETPGRELLQTVPAIGVWRDDANTPKRREKNQQVRRKILP